MSVFRSAITDTHDGTVDPGYLALFWSMIVTVTLIPGVMGFAMWLAARPGTTPEQAALLLDKAGSSCSLLAAAFAAIVAAVGGFRLGDKPRVGTVTSTVTAAQTTTAPAPA